MSSVEHRHLRSALEFAVTVAAEGAKRRPPLPFPAELRTHLRTTRLANPALGRIRRAIEGDPSFRAALAGAAVPELVDEIGQLWLAGHDGWEGEASAVIAERGDAAEEKDLRQQLRRSEKRREAAEQATVRSRTEVIALRAEIGQSEAEIDRLRGEADKAADEVAEIRVELTDTRNEVRHARDRERSALARVDAAGRRAAPESDSDESTVGLRARLAEAETDASEAWRRVDQMVAATSTFARHMDGLASPPTNDSSAGVEGARRGVRGSSRRPVELPGGVISTSAEAADHLVRAGVPVFVDGYNVAKTAFTGRTLEQQREALLDRCEGLSRRLGTEVTVVFDGSSVAGAHAGRRRDVRVVFSPEGVTADDVIRSEVAALSSDRQAVVVTNDREIVDDVRAVGVNVIPTNAFIAVF